MLEGRRVSGGLILGALVFVDLSTAFILIWNLNHGQGFNVSTFLGAQVINVLGIIALRSLKE